MGEGDGAWCLKLGCFRECCQVQNHKRHGMVPRHAGSASGGHWRWFAATKPPNNKMSLLGANMCIVPTTVLALR